MIKWREGEFFCPAHCEREEIIKTKNYEKVKSVLVITILSFCANKASATWTYYDGQSTITKTNTPGISKLTCDSQTKLCCAIDWNTHFIIIKGMVIDPNNQPQPGNGTLSGTFDTNSVVENPDQNTTVEMNVSNLHECDDCNI